MKYTQIAGIAILAMLALFVLLKFVQSQSTSEPLHVEGNTPQSQPAHPNPKATPYTYQETKDYRMIAENNLFRPLGWKKEIPKPPKPVPKVAPEPIAEMPPPPPTYALVLTGIVQSGSEWIAVVEDSERNEGVFLRQGETLKDAFVNEISPEHITLVHGEMQIQLALGETIEYSEDEQILFDTVATSRESEISGSAGSRVNRAQPDDPDTQQDLLQRMRERRRRQVGQ